MNQRQVSFGEAIRLAFVNYVNFTGRASRSEYWWFALFTFLIAFPVAIFNQVGGLVGNIVYIGVQVALILPSLGLAVRRLHDIGKSGWWLLGFYVVNIVAGAVMVVGMLPAIQSGDFEGISFAPVLGGIAICLINSVVFLVWMCKPSVPTENKYGPVPFVEMK